MTECLLHLTLFRAALHWFGGRILEWSYSSLKQGPCVRAEQSLILWLGAVGSLSWGCGSADHQALSICL